MPVPLRLAAWFPAGAGRPAGGRHFCLPGGRSGRGGRAPAPRYNVLARHSETGARRASRRDRPITRPQEGSRGAKAGIQADAPETPPGPMSRAMSIAALQAFPAEAHHDSARPGHRFFGLRRLAAALKARTGGTPVRPACALQSHTPFPYGIPRPIFSLILTPPNQPVRETPPCDGCAPCCLLPAPG